MSFVYFLMVNLKIFLEFIYHEYFFIKLSISKFIKIFSPFIQLFSHLKIGSFIFLANFSENLLVKK